MDTRTLASSLYGHIIYSESLSVITKDEEEINRSK